MLPAPSCVTYASPSIVGFHTVVEPVPLFWYSCAVPSGSDSTTALLVTVAEAYVSAVPLPPATVQPCGIEPIDGVSQLGGSSKLTGPATNRSIEPGPWSLK